MKQLCKYCNLLFICSLKFHSLIASDINFSSKQSLNLIQFKCSFLVNQFKTLIQWFSDSVHQWFSASVHQCISDSVHQWFSASVHQCISDSVIQWFSASVHQWFSDSVIQCISDSVHQCISASVHQWFSDSVHHHFAAIFQILIFMYYYIGL